LGGFFIGKGKEMKDLTQMREAIDELMKQLSDIKTKCIQENREYTKEERKFIRKIQARVDDITEQIALEEKTASLAKEQDTSIKPPPKIDPAEERTVPYGTGARITDSDFSDSFRTLGEQLMAIVVACEDGGWVDPRLRSDPRLIAEVRATGLSEGIASGGGYI